MQKFKKNEIINNKKKIEFLFAKGQRFILDDFQIIYIETEKSEVFLQTLISVPKRKIKHASDRNLLKRRIKESFRKGKDRLTSILQEKNRFINIAIIYNSEEIISYKLIEEKINLLLQRLIENA